MQQATSKWVGEGRWQDPISCLHKCPLPFLTYWLPWMLISNWQQPNSSMPKYLLNINFWVVASPRREMIFHSTWGVFIPTLFNTFSIMCYMHKCCLCHYATINVHQDRDLCSPKVLHVVRSLLYIPEWIHLNQCYFSNDIWSTGH